MNKKYLPLLLCFLTIFSTQKNYGQRLDSLVANYNDRYPLENIHVHFDKNAYNPGETIWFKAYIISGSLPSLISSNVYFELLNDKGEVLNKKVAPVIEASAAASFDIGANYNKSVVYVRAYTNWMLNFDSTFLYTKTIAILKNINTNAKKTSTLLNFFPEGGNIVAGVQNKIAFKAITENGLPAHISGKITDANKKQIATFVTKHNGMGYFSFIPEADKKYIAEWKDADNRLHETILPAAANTGVAMSLQNESGKTLFNIERSSIADEQFKKLHIVAAVDQQVVYLANFNLSDKTSISGSIPTDMLPTGIMQVTLFANNWMPVAERIVFVNNQEYFFDADIRVLTKKATARSENNIQVAITDTFKSNLSLSITDADLDMPDENADNIVSHLLLTGQLHGNIHNPYYYFSNPSDSAAKQFDLVMLTNGWRRYNWDDIKTSTYKTPTYLPENYLSLNGKLVGVNPGKFKPNESMNLILKGSDSSVQFITTTINKDATFSKKGLILFGPTQVYYQLNNNKNLSERIDMQINNGLLPNAVKAPFDTIYKPYELASNKKNIDKNKEYAETVYRNSFLNQNVKTLNEVVVKGKQKSNIEKLDEQYAKGMFSGGDGYSFDVGSDPFAVSSISIFNYLQGKVAGLQINPNTSPPSLDWRGSTPALYIDEMPAETDMLQNISMQDVAYVKVMRPPFFGASGGGGGGAIAVYTKRGAGAGTANVKGLSAVVLEGYAPMKQFYSPNYSISVPENDKADYRSTLLWQPFIFLDKNTPRKNVQFYNNDITKRFRVILEGINDNGKLVRVETIIE